MADRKPMGGIYGTPSYESLLADARQASLSPEPVDIERLATAGQPSLEYPTVQPHVRESHLVRALMTVVPHILNIPKRAIDASEELRQGGQYNPAPVLEAATMGLSPDPNMVRGLISRYLMRGGQSGTPD